MAENDQSGPEVSLGQIAYETASPKSDWHEPWEIVPDFARVGWEAAAQAVATKVRGETIEECIAHLTGQKNLINMGTVGDGLGNYSTPGINTAVEFLRSLQEKKP